MDEKTTQEQTNETKSNLRDPGAWVLLSFLTLGIFYFIWMFHLTRDIRKLEGHEHASYVEFIIAILIFPYSIYYVYKLAKRTEALSSQAQIMVIEDLGISALLMSLVPTGGIIALAIVQATLNKMVGAKEQA